MKKTLILLMSVMLIISLFTSCGTRKSNDSSHTDTSVINTIYPVDCTVSLHNKKQSKYDFLQRKLLFRRKNRKFPILSTRYRVLLPIIAHNRLVFLCKLCYIINNSDEKYHVGCQKIMLPTELFHKNQQNF